MGKQNKSIKFWNNIYVCTTNYHQDNWSKLLAMVEFAYNNTMHSSTQQTHFFVIHALHPQFDIQGMYKVVNPVAED